MGIHRPCRSSFDPRRSDLNRRQHMSRSADPQDRRRWLLHLRAEGAMLISRLRPLAEASEGRLLSAFGKADQQLLLSLLRRFVDSFNDLSPAPVDGTERPRARSRLHQV